MPSQIVVKNGRKVQQVAGGQDLDLGPADAAQGGPAKPSLTHRVLHALGNASPEIAATGAAFAAPETFGASLILPPLAAGATEAGREYFSGEDLDPAKILTRTGLNAIPGVVGKVAGRFMGAPARALESMGQGDNWVSTLARGANSLISDPVAEKAGTKVMARATRGATGKVAQLMERLNDPTLNGPAKAAIVQAIRRLQSTRSTGVANSIRGILGLASAVQGDE